MSMKNSKTRVIMIQGTMSGAGKSLLCAGLCRIFAKDGYRVAPFKSQNMALNSYVTKEGLEMGRAQVMQAEAAGVAPEAAMNPILLKPSSDVGSQVIVNGVPVGYMSAREYFEYKKTLLPEIRKAFDKLASENDIIVIEGAGSPAEINLKDNDIVNMGLAEYLDAPVLLVGDIDRGGVFAQLYGTVKLLDPKEQARIKGLIINKFRGDVTLLDSGIRQIEELTGIPVAGVVPYTHLLLDDEDSLAPELTVRTHQKPVDVAVIRLPHISNFTDLTPLSESEILGVRYVERAGDLERLPDLIILPGTKNTIGDLKWLRETGLFSSIQKAHKAGTVICGICGGYQMLGEEISDFCKAESETPCTVQGLGILPVRTSFSLNKTRTLTEATVGEAPISGELKGAKIRGYEIHMGETKVLGEPFAMLPDGKREGCTEKNAFGTYLHGLFDTGEMTEALERYFCTKKQIPCKAAPIRDYREIKEEQYDRLAAELRKSLDMKKIYEIMGIKRD